MYSFLQLIHIFLLKLFQLLQPYLGPICLVLAWTVVILTIWNITAAFRDGLQRAQTMHRIPCADCKFFTNQAVLKCPVNPGQAMSEQAIGCSDFETADPVWAAQLKLKTKG